MRAVIQRTTGASVEVEQNIVGEIERGLVVFLGIEEGDTTADLQYICDKVVGIRVFDDENEIPNLSVQDIGGSILLISQFTLCADARKGKRPSYIKAAPSEQAIPAHEAVSDCENFRRAYLCNAAFSRQICRCVLSTTARIRYCWIRRSCFNL
ncbi:MAG: D-aminoacyl-tRNA deacylase [Eubacteriales bacterium]